MLCWLGCGWFEKIQQMHIRAVPISSVIHPVCTTEQTLCFKPFQVEVWFFYSQKVIQNFLANCSPPQCSSKLPSESLSTDAVPHVPPASQVNARCFSTAAVVRLNTCDGWPRPRPRWSLKTFPPSGWRRNPGRLCTKRLTGGSEVPPK